MKEQGWGWDSGLGVEGCGLFRPRVEGYEPHETLRSRFEFEEAEVLRHTNPELGTLSPESPYPLIKEYSLNHNMEPFIF